MGFITASIGFTTLRAAHALDALDALGPITMSYLHMYMRAPGVEDTLSVFSI